MDKKTLEESTKVETVITLGMEIEELEEKIAPGRGLNHNETLVLDDMES